MLCRMRKEQVLEKRLLSIAEASYFLGISKSFLYQLAASGEIPSLRFGRAVRFDLKELNAWLDGAKTDDHPVKSKGKQDWL